MGASSKNTPDFCLFQFAENATRPGVYDLVGTPENPPIRYFRLSTPRAQFLVLQGAKYVLETWEGGVKTAFTGLVPAVALGYYYGDLVEVKRDQKRRKSFVVFYLRENTVTVYYFRSYTLFPAKRLPFINRFISQLS